MKVQTTLECYKQLTVSITLHTLIIITSLELGLDQLRISRNDKPRYFQNLELDACLLSQLVEELSKTKDFT